MLLHLLKVFLRLMNWSKNKLHRKSPYCQAIKRMGERNNLTEEQAKQRLGSQMTNQERVQRSNVILSSLWEPEYTQSQVRGGNFFMLSSSECVINSYRFENCSHVIVSRIRCWNFNTYELDR